MLALFSTASLLLIATAAAAQDGTAPTARTPASDATTPPKQEIQGTAPEPIPTGVQEVVVTAQRRSENVQRSSLSIQVLGGGVLQRAGVTQASDLNTLVPGIQIAAVGATVQVSIRGISDNSSNVLGSPSVSFNVDGVYIGRPTSISSSFFDVSRIEVLKGPQARSTAETPPAAL